MQCGGPSGIPTARTTHLERPRSTAAAITSILCIVRHPNGTSCKLQSRTLQRKPKTANGVVNSDLLTVNLHGVLAYFYYREVCKVPSHAFYVGALACSAQPLHTQRTNLLQMSLISLRRVILASGDVLRRRGRVTHPSGSELIAINRHNLRTIPILKNDRNSIPIPILNLQACGTD